LKTPANKESMFGISDLIYRHFDRRLDLLHNHIKYMKDGLRADIKMNHDEELSRLNNLTNTIGGLVTRVENKVAELTAESAAKDVTIADLQAQLATASVTTPDIDDAFAAAEAAVAAADAAIPAETQVQPAI
jgi:rhamnose utilization protein RhaD (predicted bifunctional aldolase and dehydrogenase)